MGRLLILLAVGIGPAEVMVLLAIGVPLAGLMVGLGILAFWMDRVGKASLDRIVGEVVSRSESDSSPPVDLAFCAYRSCIIFWTQVEYRMTLPYDTAILLLRQLHNYTLRWGWLGPAAIIIPWSFLSYGIQRHAIRRQLGKLHGARVARPVERSETTVFSPLVSVREATSPETRSIFRVVVGWVCIGLCVLFVISAVAALFQAEYVVAVGGVIAGLIFWLIASEWIRKGRGIQDRED
jgi:hypothetical protein